MHPRGPVPEVAHDGLARLPPHPLVGRAQVLQPEGRGVDDPEHVGRVLGELGEALLALAQGRLGPAALTHRRDVVAHGAEEGEFLLVEAVAAARGERQRAQ
jgi:hypothetical protein